MTAATTPASAVPIDGHSTTPSGAVPGQTWPGVAVTITPLLSPSGDDTNKVCGANTTLEASPAVPGAPGGTSLAPSSAWYVVSKGITPGIYSSWLAAAPQVTGVSGCIFSKYPTEALARAAYEQAWIAGTLVQVGV